MASPAPREQMHVILGPKAQDVQTIVLPKVNYTPGAALCDWLLGGESLTIMSPCIFACLAKRQTRNGAKKQYTEAGRVLGKVRFTTSLRGFSSGGTGSPTNHNTIKTTIVRSVKTISLRGRIDWNRVDEANLYEQYDSSYLALITTLYLLDKQFRGRISE